MTNQEKELIELIGSYLTRRLEDHPELQLQDMAKAIIAKFPQIEKKPVKIEVYEYDTPSKKVEYAIKLFQPFDTKLERMQWIEAHDVEVYQ